jgi:hypothetical protein
MDAELAELIAKAVVDPELREKLKNNPDALVGLSFEDKKALLLALEQACKPATQEVEMGVESRATKWGNGGEGPWENTPFTG